VENPSKPSENFGAQCKLNLRIEIVENLKKKHGKNGQHKQLGNQEFHCQIDFIVLSMIINPNHFSRNISV
jgi:hypothetical protein